MQVVNTDSFKALDGLQPQSGNRRETPSMSTSSFKDAIRKVIEGEAQATAIGAFPAAASSGEKLFGEFITMMSRANITEAGISTLPLGIEGEQAALPIDPGILSETVQFEAAVPIVGQPAKDTETAPVVQIVNKPENATREKQASTAGQQTANAETAKQEHTVKDRQGNEKSVVVKNGENAAKNAEVKQDTAKEVRQEFTGTARQEAATDPEKLYVKVGEGNKLNSEKFAKDVSDKIFTKMSDGVKQFEIELAPKELGKILIKLIMLNGKAEVMIQCLNPKTQQLVTSSAETIRAIIEDRTGAHTTVTVKEDEEAKEGLERDGRQGNQDEQQEQQQDKKWDEADTMIFLQQLRLGLTEELKT